MRGSWIAHPLLVLATSVVLPTCTTAAATPRAPPSLLSSSTRRTISSSGTTSSSSSSSSCNGSPDLCGRPYNAVTHMGAHNSAFVRDASTGESISGNQYFDAIRALDDGLRLLQAQVQDQDGTIQLCHSSCSLLDAGPLADWLARIKTWLDGHPDDVVTLLLVNGGNQDVDEFGKVFEAAGLDKYGYVPPSSSSSSSGQAQQWPTLQEMITAKTRLVVFIASVDPSTKYPYLLSEFDYIFETPYAVTSPEGFNCTLDRPQNQPWSSSPGAAMTAGKMSLMNHFMYNTLGSIMFPASEDVATTNSPGKLSLSSSSKAGVGSGNSSDSDGTLGSHAMQCINHWGGVKPTFVLVDFYSEGPAMATANRLNELSATSNPSNSVPASPSGGDGGGGVPGSSPAGTAAHASSPAPSVTTTAGINGGGSGVRVGLGPDNGVAFGLIVFIVGALIMI